jgi:hypothetical protein
MRRRQMRGPSPRGAGGGADGGGAPRPLLPLAEVEAIELPDGELRASAHAPPARFALGSTRMPPYPRSIRDGGVRFAVAGGSIRGGGGLDSRRWARFVAAEVSIRGGGA